MYWTKSVSRPLKSSTFTKSVYLAFILKWLTGSYMLHYITLDITVQALFFWTKWSKTIDKSHNITWPWRRVRPAGRSAKIWTGKLKPMVVYISTCSFKQLSHMCGRELLPVENNLSVRWAGPHVFCSLVLSQINTSKHARICWKVASHYYRNRPANVNTLKCKWQKT